MDCPSCHSEIPDDSRFCDVCGAAFPSCCPSCGAPNRAGARFCSKCGKALTADSPTTHVRLSAAATAPASQPADAAERRQLTVMFCDLVGSTALSARLDPEDTREVLHAYQGTCARVIANHGGFVAKFMGDGVLAYFGFPHAHEDDAERAVRAGLAMAPALAKLKTRARASLQVRVGIATGLVVVGDLVGEGSAQERAVVGETPSLAARLQALAEPGSVVVAGSTRRLLGDLFRLRELGPQDAKGFADKVIAWAVEGLSSSENRFEAAHVRLTGFVGREEEIGLLLDRKNLAWRGEGQIVLVSGEPGIGKSRLAAQLSKRIAPDAHTRLRYQCSPYHRHSALHPFIAQLERAAEFTPDDAPEQRLDKLQALLALGTPRVPAVAPLFAALLSIPVGQRYPPLTLSPAQQRRQTLAALLDQFEGLAHQRPILLLFEDVHWADPTSIELLDLTVDRIRHLPVLALFTFRPEYEPPWAGLPEVTSLELGRLDESHVQTMVEQVTGGRRLPAEVTGQIIAKTDGIPLFVEELTKTVLEAGILVEDTGRYRLDGPLPPLAIPATLHDSLMARLDRLASVKEIAQVAAAIGREFSFPLLRMVVGRDESALRSGVAQLEEAGLVFRRGELPDAAYAFKHALVQDTAYESLLKSRRQVLHRRLAEALRDRFPAAAETQPEVVARHFTLAGLTEAAAEWWGKAGDLALRRSAYNEAIAHLEKALGLADSLADGPAQRQLRLRLQITQGNALIWSHGYHMPQTTAAFARARELAAGIEDAPERFSAYYGLWVGSLTRAEPAHGEVAAAFLRDAERRPRSPEAGVAHRVSGVTCWFQGDFLGARVHFEHALAIYDPTRDRELAFRFGQDTGIAAKIFLALTLWPLGEIDRARSCAEEAISQAAQCGHVPTLCYAHSFKCHFEALRRDTERARTHAEALVGHSREHGLSMWLASGTVFERWARWRSGHQDVGVAALRESRATFNALGNRLINPLFAALVAEAEASEGRIEAAFAILDNQLAETAESGQRWHDAELHRLRGELLLKRQPVDAAEAEAAFTRAIEIARDQQARSFELRASTSLARLWRDQGKRAEVRDLLARIYGWFTEGFDTLDLKQAKALLDELAS
jgi:class 3 adenylate cyclase/predicted ATPase